MKTILIGVSGSISAYKSADIVSRLKKDNWDVHVVMTQSASQFISPLTLEVLSGNKVFLDTFSEENPGDIYHVDIVKKIDVFMIAPASAHTISKIAYGLADNMLSNIALVAHDKIKVFAPAMNTSMYENPIIQENMNKLKQHNWLEIEPRSSLLACGDVGVGALANTDDIVAYINGLEL
mgnify:CR=1 FL=1